MAGCYYEVEASEMWAVVDSECELGLILTCCFRACVCAAAHGFVVLVAADLARYTPLGRGFLHDGFQASRGSFAVGSTVGGCGAFCIIE